MFIAKLTAFTRKDAEFYVEAEGGKVLSDVSAALNYLICGKGAKKERDIAEDIGTVTILTEKAFLKIMKSNAEKK